MLVNRLSRGLFVSEGMKDIDIHPAETLLSALFGKDGNLSLKFPTELSVRNRRSAKH